MTRVGSGDFFSTACLYRLYSAMWAVAISSTASIISWREVWTRQSATYFAVSESTFPTSEVNDGRPSAPGAGWVMSAPITSVGFRGSVRAGAERASRIVLIPPTFTLILRPSLH